ncbi:MAG: glycosyltransferase family 61 protein [Verrucomicrobiales bacterium]|jgi:hypothetical protein|nr:glycosyltransferase family 61 protein [Verrucomicrobiales bacterium]
MIHQVPYIYFDGPEAELKYIDHKNKLYPTVDPTVFRERQDLIEPGLKNNIEIDVVVNTKWHNAYFHYLEVILCIWAVQQEFNPSLNIKNIYIGNNYSGDSAQRFQSVILNALFPEANFVTECSTPERAFIYIDRHLRYDKNVMLHSVFDMARRHSTSFKKRVQSALNIVPRIKGDRSLNIIYATRLNVKQRILAPQVEQILLEVAQSYGSVMPIDFGRLHIKDQIRISQQADIIIGGQGSNMANLIWLPDWGSALELRLPDTQVYDMQSMAEIFNIDYLGLMGNEIIPSHYYKAGERGDNTRHFEEINEGLLRRCFNILTGRK